MNGRKLFIDLFSCLSLGRGAMETDRLSLVPVAVGGMEDQPLGLIVLPTGMCIEKAWRFNPSFGG